LPQLWLPLFHLRDQIVDPANSHFKSDLPSGQQPILIVFNFVRFLSNMLKVFCGESLRLERF
jgi:hypothetical protein